MQSKTDTEKLVELSRSLHLILQKKLATQLEIQRATGVDQPTISRARSGKLKRLTAKVEVLQNYANMKLSPPTASKKISDLATRFYEAGGTDAELEASIEHAIKLLTRQLKERGE